MAYRKPRRTHTLPPTAPLSQQVGGHAGVQVSEDESLLFKPALPREIAFYERIARGDVGDISTGLNRLEKWTPKFYGLLSLVGKPLLPIAGNEAGIVPPIIPPPGLESGFTTNCSDDNNGAVSLDATSQTLVLQNLLHGYRKPCVLDVKLGTVLYDEDTPEEKKARMIKKAANSTTFATGMRLTGFQVYSNQSPDPTVYGKAYGYGLKPEQLHEGITSFFPCSTSTSSANANPVTLATSDSNIGLPAGILRTLLKQIHGSLVDLRGALSNAELRMVGGSVLIIYEGDWERAAIASGRGGGPPEGEGKVEEEDESDEIEVEIDEQGEIIMESIPGEASEVSPTEPRPRLYTISLIDFAHTRVVPGQGPDQGVLMGLDTLVKLVDDRKRKVGTLIESGNRTN